GRVVGAHGLRGQLRVSVLGDDAANLMRVPAVWLSPTEEEPGAGRFEVASVAPGRRGEVRMTLSGVRDRDAADALRGLLVLGCVADLERLPPGEYYAYELVGCRVEDGAGRTLGVVRGIWETGAPSVLVLEGADGAEHLIPAADEILQEVDVEGRRIVIDAIPGLLEQD
ncbi:MAG: ribosome maturation factor RimM, partial [Myxococcales bacterium]|nr:ribosome maturation factor RimM [Myxococcales bacterium]